jgi:hypothetical protein
MYVANTSGSASIDGVEYTFTLGITRHNGDHPLVKGCPLYFDPEDDSTATKATAPAVEQATAAPGELRNK